MNYKDGESVAGVGCGLLVGLVIIAAIIGGVWGCNKQVDAWITQEEAVGRFQEIAGTEDIEVIRMSNNNPFFGDAEDVTFELLVNGEPVTGRCHSAIFSKMICRLYTGGD